MEQPGAMPFFNQLGHAGFHDGRTPGRHRFYFQRAYIHADHSVS